MRQITFPFAMLMAALPLWTADNPRKTDERLQDAAGLFQ